MTKEQIQVALVGRAHSDAQELLRKSNAGVSLDYIAYSDGTVTTINRQIMGVLHERLAPIKKPRSAKTKQFVKHGYRKDVLNENRKKR